MGDGRWVMGEWMGRERTSGAVPCVQSDGCSAGRQGGWTKTGKEGAVCGWGWSLVVMVDEMEARYRGIVADERRGNRGPSSPRAQ